MAIKSNFELARGVRGGIKKLDLGLVPNVSTCGHSGGELITEFAGLEMPTIVDADRFKAVLSAIIHPIDELLYREQRQSRVDAHIKRVKKALERAVRRNKESSVLAQKQELSKYSGPTSAPNIVYVPQNLWQIAIGLAGVNGPVKTGFFSSISATDQASSGLGVIAWPDRVAASLVESRNIFPDNEQSQLFQRLAAFGSVNVDLNDQDEHVVHAHHLEQITLLRSWWARFRPEALVGLETYGFISKEKITFPEKRVVEAVFNELLSDEEKNAYRLLAEKAGGNPENAIKYLTMHLGTPISGALDHHHFDYQRILFSGGSDRDFLRDHFRVLDHLGMTPDSPHGYAGIVTSAGPEGPAYNGPRKGELSIQEAVNTDFSGENGLKRLKTSLKSQPGTRWMTLVAAREGGVSNVDIQRGLGFNEGVRSIRDFLSDSSLRSDINNIN